MDWSDAACASGAGRTGTSLQQQQQEQTAGGPAVVRQLQQPWQTRRVPTVFFDATAMSTWDPAWLALATSCAIHGEEGEGEKGEGAYRVEATGGVWNAPHVEGTGRGQPVADGMADGAHPVHATMYDAPLPRAAPRRAQVTPRPCDPSHSAPAAEPHSLLQQPWQGVGKLTLASSPASTTHQSTSSRISSDAQFTPLSALAPNTAPGRPPVHPNTAAQYMLTAPSLATRWQPLLDAPSHEHLSGTCRTTSAPSSRSEYSLPDLSVLWLPQPPASASGTRMRYGHMAGLAARMHLQRQSAQGMRTHTPKSRRRHPLSRSISAMPNMEPNALSAASSAVPVKGSTGSASASAAAPAMCDDPCSIGSSNADADVSSTAASGISTSERKALLAHPAVPGAARTSIRQLLSAPDMYSSTTRAPEHVPPPEAMTTQVSCGTCDTDQKLVPLFVNTAAPCQPEPGWFILDGIVTCPRQTLMNSLHGFSSAMTSQPLSSIQELACEAHSSSSFARLMPEHEARLSIGDLQGVSMTGLRAVEEEVELLAAGVQCTPGSLVSPNRPQRQTGHMQADLGVWEETFELRPHSINTAGAASSSPDLSAGGKGSRVGSQVGSALDGGLLSMGSTATGSPLSTMLTAVLARMASGHLRVKAARNQAGEEQEREEGTGALSHSSPATVLDVMEHAATHDRVRTSSYSSTPARRAFAHARSATSPLACADSEQQGQEPHHRRRHSSNGGRLSKWWGRVTGAAAAGLSRRTSALGRSNMGRVHASSIVHNSRDTEPGLCRRAASVGGCALVGMDVPWEAGHLGSPSPASSPAASAGPLTAAGHRSKLSGLLDGVFRSRCMRSIRDMKQMHPCVLVDADEGGASNARFRNY